MDFTPNTATLSLSCGAILLAAAAGCTSASFSEVRTPWRMNAEPAPGALLGYADRLVGSEIFSAVPSGGAKAYGPVSSDLSVVTFNMKHRDRPAELKVLAEYLEDLDNPPDFMLCQEVLFQRNPWRGQHDTAAVLADDLGLYSRGTKRKSDREGVAIISRYPFDFYDELHLKARTSAFLLGFRRVSVMGEFVVPRVGRVRVVNVHLAYQSFENHVRRKQLAETLEWLAARERLVHADVTILGGDFNMEPDRKEWAVLDDRTLTGNLKFVDANTDAPTFGADEPYKRVDYLFVAAPDQDVKLLRERVLFKEGLWRLDGSGRFWPSDHLPVCHEYSLR